MVSKVFGWLSSTIISLQALLLLAFFWYAGSWLSTPSSSATKSDLIVVLGGGTGDRLKKGAQLYMDKMADTILVTGMLESKLGIEPLHSEWRSRYLLQFGVPEDRILRDSTAKSTLEEIELLKKVMKKEGWHSVLIVSDPAHMRRLFWMLSKQFSCSDLSYRLISSHPGWWNARYWWENPHSASFVISESVKLVYYASKHIVFPKNRDKTC